MGLSDVVFGDRDFCEVDELIVLEDDVPWVFSELVKTCLFDIWCGLNFDLREELVVSGGAGFKEGIPPTDVSNGDERLVGGELRLNKRSAIPPSEVWRGLLLPP